MGLIKVHASSGIIIEQNYIAHLNGEWMHDLCMDVFYISNEKVHKFHLLHIMQSETWHELRLHHYWLYMQYDLVNFFHAQI